MNKPNIRALTAGGRSVATAAIVLAAAVLVNVLLGALPTTMTQFDTTSSQIFELSDQTKNLVQKLEEPINIYWVTQTGYEDTYIETLLQRYTDLSGKITVSKKDPDVNPTFVEKYTSEEVSNNSLIVECGDRYQFIANSEIFVVDYMSYFTTGEYTTEFEGEGVLTSAIVYVTNEDLPKIYNLTGHGETDLPESFSNAVKRQSMELESLSLLTVSAIPEDADAILIHAPQTDITAAEKDMLLSYLQSGGSMFLIAGRSAETRTNLEELMSQYAVTTREGIVVEGDQSHYIQGTPYYLIPDMAAHTATNPLLESNYYMLLSLSQSLISDPDRPDTLRITELLTTSSEAYAKQGENEAVSKEEGDVDGPFTLAVAITDTLTNTNIVYVAADSLTDETLNERVSGANQDFFLNVLSWMCEYEDGITIHAKSLDVEYLTIEETSATTFAVLIIGIIPVMYLAIGVVITIRRKRR